MFLCKRTSLQSIGYEKMMTSVKVIIGGHHLCILRFNQLEC